MKNDYVYVVVSSNGLFKLGLTSQVRQRVAQLKSSSPVECELLAVLKSKNADDLEKSLHSKYHSLRVRGEWFALSKKDLFEILDPVNDLKLLLNEMETWGFFQLGMSELINNVSKAILYRVTSLKSLEQFQR